MHAVYPSRGRVLSRRTYRYSSDAMSSTESDAGPRVQTIFALRIVTSASGEPQFTAFIVNHTLPFPVEGIRSLWTQYYRETLPYHR